MPSTKRFVYILQSESNPGRFYTGLTAGVQLRLADHNQGRYRHTSSGMPWKVAVVNPPLTCPVCGRQLIIECGESGLTTTAHEFGFDCPCGHWFGRVVLAGQEIPNIDDELSA